MIDRAAQFSPFAALTGYGEVIKETARLTDRKPELSESEKAELDYKLQMACDYPGEKPALTITYFVPDQRKAGGSYHTISGQIKKIDDYQKQVILMDKTRIDLYIQRPCSPICAILRLCYSGLVIERKQTT